MLYPQISTKIHKDPRRSTKIHAAFVDNYPAGRPLRAEEQEGEGDAELKLADKDGIQVESDDKTSHDDLTVASSQGNLSLDKSTELITSTRALLPERMPKRKEKKLQHIARENSLKQTQEESSQQGLRPTASRKLPRFSALARWSGATGQGSF